MPELSKKEIEQRLIKLRNFEMLYPKARQRIDKLEKENRLLKSQLAEVVASYDVVIEKLKLRIEELERMVFGRRKKEQTKGSNQIPKNERQSREREPRDPNSYRKELPKEEEITSIRDYPVEACPNCGTPLEDLNLIIQYKEDIAFLNNILKQIEKQRVQTGYCPHCKKRSSSLPIQPQTVYLGENIKQLICYLIIVLNLSFEKANNLIRDLANIKVSDGEISNILENEAKKLLPHHHKIKANIRAQPCSHYDETSWQVQKEEQGRFGWVMTGTQTPETIFHLGQSRGKGNAEKLKGTAQEQVAITDDYGAYRNLFKHHQLCWAHPLRKLRDLALAANLTEQSRKHCQKVHHSLIKLHHSLKEELIKPFDLNQRQQAKQRMLKQLVKLSQAHPQDPSKLRNIKEALLKNKEKYFTCLLFQGIPTTNNKAERALRHLVLKRKSSFGSKTQKGAEVMSILCSVLLSLWWKKPKNFFQEYSLLLNST